MKPDPEYQPEPGRIAQALFFTPFLIAEWWRAITRPKLRLRCSWCQRWMRSNGETTNRAPFRLGRAETSHGICRACDDAIRKQEADQNWTFGL